MNSIKKELQVPLPPKKAFHHFVYDLNEWWPKEYTWSGENLKEIKIMAKINGLCTETGPFGFRCDWGRVIEFQENKLIAFTWQISPQRIPEPDPNKASLVTVQFTEQDGQAFIQFNHSRFENHGDGAEEYSHAMNSEQGWGYILGRYKSYCKKM